MSLGTLFKRPYTKVHDIEHLNVDQILQIPPNEISTTKIMAETEVFKAIDPTKQAAVKFIAEQKRMRDEHKLRYPTPDEMVRYFKDRQNKSEQVNNEVDNLIFEARVENLHDNSDRIKNLHNYTEAMKIEAQLPSPPTGSTLRRKGGKKRSRKQRKQRRRKTRRSV